jgi:hypothetical protein
MSSTDYTFTDEAFGKILYNVTSTKDDEILQKIQYTSDFMDLFVSIVVKDLNESGSVFENELAFNIFLKDFVALHIKNLTGSKSCKPHVGGGALFWFTIMTTVGYVSMRNHAICYMVCSSPVSFILTLVTNPFFQVRQRRSNDNQWTMAHLLVRVHYDYWLSRVKRQYVLYSRHNRRRFLDSNSSATSNKRLRSCSFLVVPPYLLDVSCGIRCSRVCRGTEWRIISLEGCVLVQLYHRNDSRAWR